MAWQHFWNTAKASDGPLLQSSKIRGKTPQGQEQFLQKKKNERPRDIPGKWGAIQRRCGPLNIESA